MKKNVCKKILAGFSAVVMLVASFGVMPIVSAAGTVTTVVGPITFEEFTPGTYPVASYNSSAPANQKFNDNEAQADATIAITEENGDKYANFTGGTGQFIWYRPQDNACINEATYQPPTQPGDQLVISTELLAGGTKAEILQLTSIMGDATTPTQQMLAIINKGAGQIRVYTGAANYVLGQNVNNYTAATSLTTGSWHGVDFVYTVGDSANGIADTLTVYADGAFVATYDMQFAGLPAGVFQKGEATGRIELDGEFDNFSVRTFTGGAQFALSDCTTVPEPVIINTLLDMDFNDAAYSNLYAQTADHIYTSTQDVKWAEFTMVKTGGKLEVIKDADNDYSVKVTESTLSQFWPTDLTGIDLHPGLLEDEQLVVSTKLHTGTTHQGFDFVTRDQYNVADGSTGAHRIQTKTFSYANGVLTIYNGGGLDLTATGGTNWGGYTPPILSDVAKQIDVPVGEWIDLILVYTKKADNGSYVDVYINGNHITRAPLVATYILDGQIYRTLLFNGHVDDLGIKSLRSGAQYDPSGLTGTDIVIEHTDSTNLKYTALEYLVDDETTYQRAGQTLDADVDGIYGKTAGDKAINIVKDTRTEMDGDYDMTEDITEEGYTFSDINKRLRLLVGESFGKLDYAMPVSISFDILAQSADEFRSANIAGNFITDAGADKPGTQIFGLSASADGISVLYNACDDETPNELVAVEGIDPIAYKEWHNIELQFTPGQAKIKVYVDGNMYEVDIPKYTDTTKFNGFGNLNFDLSGSALIDNLTIKGGTLVAPAQRGTVELAFEGNDDAWSRGFAWNGTNITSDKMAGLTIPYNDIAANFTNGTLLAADGTVAVADGQVQQIALTDANGYIHYFKIMPREGKQFTKLADGTFVLDLADGSNYTADKLNFFVVTFADNAVTNVEIATAGNMEIIGDTIYISGMEINAGDVVYAFEDGTLKPLGQAIPIQ